MANNDNDDRVPLEKRVRGLANEMLDDLAHLIVSKDKEEVEALEESVRQTATRLGALTGEDPNLFLESVSRLVEQQKELIDEDLVEERNEAVAKMIIAQVKAMEEYERVVAEQVEQAEGATRDVEDLERESEGGQEGEEGEGEPDDEHTPEVDDSVLEGLDTVYAN